MSGSTAKAARRAERDERLARMEEALLQVHNALHDDAELDLERLHGIVHHGLGVEDADVIVINPMAQMMRFDQRFRALVRTEGVVATYIALDPHDRHGHRLISGGAAKLTARVDTVMRKGVEAMTAENEAINKAAMAAVSAGTAEAIAREIAAEDAGAA